MIKTLWVIFCAATRAIRQQILIVMPPIWLAKYNHEVALHMQPGSLNNGGSTASAFFS